MKQHTIKWIIVISLFIFTGFAYSQTSRGRVQIQDGTLVTDRGTLLRGAYTSTDMWNSAPLREDVSLLKTYGLNCIHLYGECPELQTPGEQVELIDSVVNMAEKDSLYVILTIGGCNLNGQYDSAFVMDFWEFYAQRYADKEHLIFEIVNEPEWEAPFDSNLIVVERAAYDLIRSHAPETHILFMSYAHPYNDTSIVQDCKKLGEGVDWTNASVACHGYGIASEDFRSFFRTIQDSGYAITLTEPESIENTYVNLATTRVFEDEFVSYAHFVSVYNVVHTPATYKTRVEASELRWTPDFGTWPENLTQINYIDPYKPIEAGFYDEGYGLKLIYPEARLGYISNNDYVAYYNLNFEDVPDSLLLECSSENSSGGSMQIILDSLEGPVVGLFPVHYTGSWDTYNTYSCIITAPVEGIHRIYFIFQADHPWDFVNLKSLQFKKAGLNSAEGRVHSANGAFTIYPNPASDHICVNVDTETLVEIWSLQGILLQKKILSVCNNNVALYNLSPGNYVIKLIARMKVISTILTIQ